MGFMTNEEIVDLKRSTRRVDAITTKRTCTTCFTMYKCPYRFVMLHKTPEKGCDCWNPGFMTCGLCKHSALSPDIRYSLYCVRCSYDREEFEVGEDPLGCDDWELLEELERTC